VTDAESQAVNELRVRAGLALDRLRGLSSEDVEAIRSDVAALRDARQYDLMAKLAEALSRRFPHDVENRKLYAQCMIETGYCTAAVDVLHALIERLSPDDREWAEAFGLLGRAYKQIFFDCGDKSSREAIDALGEAIAAYGKPWARHRANTWHGVNIVALVTCGRRLKLAVPADLDIRNIANEVIRSISDIPVEKRDPIWHPATLAEAYLALGDLAAVEREVHRYAGSDRANAFAVASTLRQFTELWDLDKGDERERSIVGALRARLLDLDGHALRVDPREARDIERFAASAETLEAVLGEHGAETYRSMQIGMRRAASVASIWRNKPNSQMRWGTGFLVRAGDFDSFGRRDIEPEQVVLLTNWHVVNENGLHPGIRPDEALVRFEAASPPSSHEVGEIIWTRGVELHDAAFLRLKGDPPNVEPLVMAKRLPVVHSKARVFIIGYPGGRDLALSLQDNKLVRHEGPPDGKPLVEGVVRVHYRAPTEQGSSGSPVFDADGEWEVVALHHAGPAPGTNLADAANEGIALSSIRDAVLSERKRVDGARRSGESGSPTRAGKGGGRA
jgi:hypothetical protein